MSDFRETLYTIDTRGNRRWVYLSQISGFFGKRRRIVAAILLLIYLITPWIQINGLQAVRLDIAHRKFIILGQVFWATDTRFLLLSLLTLGLSLFFFTSVFGRVWCGWACPETIFLEFIFRPIEILIEGNAVARLKLDQAKWTFSKIKIKALKYFIFSFIAWWLASTVLAYFLGREELIAMISDYPWNNFSTYLLTLALMGVLLFQFGWFREQFCTVLCPYARFQSVLLDTSSLLVGYDSKRGEPRGKVSEKNIGDCIDCGLCVRVCPTGIDIRNGLQLECIQCAQCADACDSIMTKIGRPTGLIRYSTENSLAGKKTKFLRIRVLVYGLILTTIFAVFGTMIFNRSFSEAQILHSSKDDLYAIEKDGLIINHLELRLENKSTQARTFSVEVKEPQNAKLVVPLASFPVAAASHATLPIFLKFESTQLTNGKVNAIIIVKDDNNFVKELKFELIGPG